MVKTAKKSWKKMETLVNASFLMGKHREKLARSGESSVSSFENHGNLGEISRFLHFFR
jgi:hypothetical protein